MKNNKTAYVEERSQKSRGGLGFGGPDTYVAVQVVPNGVTPLIYLNSNNATKRGIEIIYCGEGYSDRTKTKRSMLNQARIRAQQIADSINND